ncbi:hypothetical protein HanIR_Chr13g0621341 [Helianthus annuus]|nr:hypothetical protein HanIR_Chr13g0621341 [Helianthus annuus]
MALNVTPKPEANVEEIRVDAGVSAMISRHHRVVVARVRDFDALVLIRKLLLEAGFGEVEVQYVGGFNILIVFGNVESVLAFQNREEVWKDWFSYMDIWLGQALAFERVAWLRVHGVPLHLFCDEVVNVICKKYGTVVKPPQIGEEDGDLSMVCVGVLVGEGKRIIEEVSLSWQDKKYRVWISEDLGDGIPDCIDPDNDSESEHGVSVVGLDMFSSKLKADPSGNRKDESSESRREEGDSSLHGEELSALAQLHAEGNSLGLFSRRGDRVI